MLWQKRDCSFWKHLENGELRILRDLHRVFERLNRFFERWTFDDRVVSDDAVRLRIYSDNLEFNSFHFCENHQNCWHDQTKLWFLTPENDESVVFVNRTINSREVWFQVDINKISDWQYSSHWKVNKTWLTYPLISSTVSSMGKMQMPMPYVTSEHEWIDTISFGYTRKLVRTTRFMRIISFGQLTSVKTMQTVSLRPFNNTVSPRAKPNSSNFARDIVTIELSSYVKTSSTTSRFANAFLFWREKNC